MQILTEEDLKKSFEEIRREVLELMTPEERLEGLGVEERLHGLGVEELKKLRKALSEKLRQ